MNGEMSGSIRGAWIENEQGGAKTAVRDYPDKE
jgi:hypothetical protein